MAFLRPDADSIDGNWLNESGNNTNLFSSLDETSASDTDYIQSPTNPVNEVCKIALSNPAGALVEPFVLRYRFNNIGGAQLTVRLLQGTTEIAAWTETSAGWNTVPRTLTSPQFAAITDFNDLFVELKANSVVSDPTLALDLDFTTGTLDSKVTFTRTTTATYVNSSGLIASAAINAPRFDYDPVTLAPRGLLIEEQRTNVIVQSQNFANGAWQSSDITKVGVAGIADPAGGSNAYEVAFGATGGAVTGAAALYVNHSGLTLGPHTTTFYVRAKTGTSSIRIGHFDGGIGTNTGSADIPITSTAWTRISFTATVTDVNAGNLSLRGNAAGTTGSVYVYGAQGESGAFATSYIPTTSAAVTRAADSAVMTGTNFSSWWNASAGTFVASFDGPASGTRPIIAADDNTANEVIMLYGSGTDPKAIVTDGGATQADLDAGTIVANTAAKLGLSFAANDFAACLNGGTVATDTGGTLPTVTQARLGSGPAGNYLTGHLASLKFYNVAKTDAELVTLTT